MQYGISQFFPASSINHMLLKSKDLLLLIIIILLWRFGNVLSVGGGCFSWLASHKAVVTVVVLVFSASFEGAQREWILIFGGI